MSNPTDRLCSITRAPRTPTDGERYRWIRSNRGSFEITDALSGSDRDPDFDLSIDAAIQQLESKSALKSSWATKVGHLNPGRPGAGNHGPK